MSQEPHPPSFSSALHHPPQNKTDCENLAALHRGYKPGGEYSASLRQAFIHSRRCEVSKCSVRLDSFRNLVV